MTDYIKREDVKETKRVFCRELYKELFGYLNDGTERIMTQEEGKFFGYNKKLGQRLDAIPAADVVEVVRCKDCKHWRQLDELEIGICGAIKDQFEPDHYCAWGKRRGEDK